MAVRSPIDETANTEGNRPFFETRRERADTPERALWDILDEIPDPHLPISLVEMGMIYDITLDDGCVTVDMTFPCLGCPAYDMIQNDVRSGLVLHEDVDSVVIDLVWEPVWTKDMLAPDVREKLRKSGIGL